MADKITTQVFIERARAAHGEKYDYSQAEYKSRHATLIIICSEHGPFQQMAGSHIRGSGCRKCYDARSSGPKRDTIWFIEKAQAVHGERYDYSKTTYLGEAKKLKVTCLLHGEFLQLPYHHLAARGCRKCGVAARAEKQRVAAPELIERIRAVHGDRYDYSLVAGKDIARRIQLICPQHGVLSMWTSEVLAGRGCRKCAWTKERYLPKFKAVHGNRYDYSEVPISFSSLDKIPIICSEHGLFYQIPAMHARGVGCPKCGIAGGFTKENWIALQKGRKAALYIISLEGNGECFFKIGITYRGISGRFGKHNMPYTLKTVALCRDYDAGKIYDLEKQLHKQLTQSRYEPLLSFGGQTECFNSVVSIIADLPTNTFFLKNRVIK